MRALAYLVGCLLWLWPLRASAQPLPEPPPLSVPEDARPWEAGASEAEQVLAAELYAAGNRLFVESRFADALAATRCRISGPGTARSGAR